MKCFIIAQVVNEYNKVVGYKLFDADAGDTMVVDINQIKTVLTKQPDIIKNACLINNTLSGTNGKLDRYPRVNKNGNLVKGDKSPLVVLNKIENVGYTVVDFKGQTAKLSNEKAVEYAKEHGIANGKIVMQESLEYISSISGEYDVKKLAPSKSGANTKVNIPIRIGGSAASVAKHTEEDIQTEMEYNDVFKAMSGEQRSVLKQYYTWYTVDAYKKMAKNVRLDLAPGKAEKLAQLRGIDKWEFAGINDSYMEGNFKAHCELGHRLRYEYFAIPEGVLDENHKVRKRAGVTYLRARGDIVKDLRDAGAIVFGETCAGDFFSISPEDMKKLVKTRKTMSDEIELMSNILTNHLENAYKSKCKLLYQVISKLGNTENVVEAFGENVGYTLLAFMKAGMPFTMSLVILAADQARKDLEHFYKTVFPEYDDVIALLLSDKTVDKMSNGIMAGKALLKFIAEYTLEGEYQYDPTLDESGLRKDIGRYNKETRNKRDTEVTSLIINTSVNVRILNDISTITNYLKAVKFYYEIGVKARNYFEATFELKQEFESLNALTLKAERLITDSYQLIKDEDNFGIKYDDNAVVKFLSAVSFLVSCSKPFFLFNEYGYGSTSKSYYYCKNKTFKILKTSSYGRGSQLRNLNAWKNIQDICNDIDETLANDLTQDKIVENALKPFVDIIRKKEDYERNRLHYLRIDLTINADKDKYRVDGCVVCKGDYITIKELTDAMNKGTKYAINTNEVDDEGILLETDDIQSVQEISESDYEYYLGTIKRQRENHKVQLEIERKRQLEKEAELAALAAKQQKEQEERENKLRAQEAKITELKKLIVDYTGDKKDYGIQTAVAILSQGLTYDKMSPKQRWRIDKTLNDLKAQKVDYDFSKFNTENVKNEPAENTDNTDNNPDTVNTPENKSLINKEILDALNDNEAAKAIELLINNVKLTTEQDGDIQFSTKVALTINRTGKISSKQKTYLMKGYSKLKDRLGN